jgi:hypothetical protein
MGNRGIAFPVEVLSKRPVLTRKVTDISECVVYEENGRAWQAQVQRSL